MPTRPRAARGERHPDAALRASQAIEMRDLMPIDRALDEAEDRWMAALAVDLDAASLGVPLRASQAADDPEPVLTRGTDGTWCAGRYVGELHRDGRTLRIEPRLGWPQLREWIGAVLGIRVVDRSGAVSSTGSPLVELVAAIWRAKLVDALRHGPPGMRRPRQHVGPTVRGRLDVGRTVALRASGRPAVASVSRPRGLDNAVTRTIVLADRVLGTTMDARGRHRWRGDRLEDLLPAMRLAVGPRPRLPTRRELARVRYTPITLPFRGAAELSWTIARGRGPLTAATGEATSGYLLDIAELWELFVVHCATRAFADESVTRGTVAGPSRHLLTSERDPARTMGRLYPDVVVRPTQAPRLVIDAKYKPLTDARRPPIAREDLYQLTSYLAAHPTATLGALGYVEALADAQPSRAERDGPWSLPTGQRVEFARLPTDEEGCVAALRVAASGR